MDHSTSSASTPASSARLPDVIAHDVSVIRERCPNIGAKIAQLWGTVDLNRYLNSVIFDERGGRQGFTEPTASALFRVYEHHQSLVHATRNPDDIWDVILDQVK